MVTQQRRSGPSFRESTSFNLANLFLWFAVFVSLIGFSGFFFHAEGRIGGAAILFGGILMGLSFAIAGSLILGGIFSLIALVRTRDRARLWPLVVPLVLLAIYIALFNMLFEHDSGAESAAFAAEKSWLLMHVLGYAAVAAFAALWLTRANIAIGLLVPLAFLLFFVRNDVAQYWTLDYFGAMHGEPTTLAARVDGDFALVLPKWLELATGATYRTVRIQVDVTPANLITDPRVYVRLTPRLFDTSATGETGISLPVGNSRVTSVTVPDFVVVSGPAGVRGAHPTGEHGWVSARIFGDDGAYPSPWLRTDQVNRMKCVVHDYATGGCEIVSAID